MMGVEWPTPALVVVAASRSQAYLRTQENRGEWLKRGILVPVFRVREPSLASR